MVKEKGKEKRREMSYEITVNDIDKVKILAGRMFRKWELGLVNFSDVFGDGLEGLAHAAVKFDVEKRNLESRSRDGKEKTLEEAFWSYATVRVNGFILNGFRSRFGEDCQKLALERTESLSIIYGDDEEVAGSHEGIVFDLPSDASVLEKIRKLDVEVVQRQVMILLAAGYTQIDAGKMLGMNKQKTQRVMQTLRCQFTYEELAEKITA